MNGNLNQPKKRYIAGLDGLRAFSVLAVIAYHLHFKWAQGGLLGVEIFFVLSGYLITDQILMEWKIHNRLSVKQFWIRRMRRLLPAMIFMLILVALWLAITDISRLQTLTGDFISSILYINNWYLIFHNVSYFESFGPPSPIGHLWSLAIEEQFYVIWPIVLLVGIYFIPQRGKLMLGILLSAALSVIAMAIIYEPGADPSRVYYGTDTRAFAILIGAALAIIWPSWKHRRRISSAARDLLDVSGLIGIIMLFILVYITNQFDDWLYPWGFLYLSVVTAVLIAILVHPANRLEKIMGNPLFSWIGKRSYSLYIWHYPVITLSTPTIDTDGTSYLRIALQLLVTVIISSLSYRYIEDPIRRGIFRVRLDSYSKQHSTVYKRGISMVLIASMMLVLAAWRTDVSKSEQIVSDPITASNQEQVQPEHLNDESTSSSGRENVIPDTISSNPTDHHQKNTVTNQKAITMIGDSVILDAKPYLEKEYTNIHVDGQIGRQMSQAQSIIEDLKGKGTLGHIIVLELGTNGVFSKNQLQSLLASLQNSQVYLVNTRVPRAWQDSVNNSIRTMADEFKNVHIVDWYTASENQDQWFYSDGVHLKPEGAKSFTDLLMNTIKSNNTY